MPVSAPRVFAVNGVLYFGDTPAKDTLVGKGFYVDFVDHRGQSANFLNEQYYKRKAFLNSLESGYNLQIQFFTDNDYTSILDYYENCDNTASDWSKFVRYEREERYAKQMKARELRWERLAFFFTKKVDARCSSAEAFDNQIRIHEADLQQRGMSLSYYFPGATIVPMNDNDHYLYYMRYLNPSMSRKEFEAVQYNEALPLLEQCWHSDVTTINAGIDGETGFHMDGHYHQYIILKRWPAQADPYTLSNIFDSLIGKLHVSQTIRTIPVEQEIREETKILNRLIAENDERNDSDINALRERIRAMGGGSIKPLRVLTVMRIWSESHKQLDEDVALLKSALLNANGAQYHLVNHHGCSRSFFYEALPGWTGSNYRDWDLYSEDHQLAMLMPISSTFRGFDDEPEALYDGNNNNIVGVRLFANGTPQHALLLGITGAGKSVVTIDLLSQTEPYFGFTAIIEEGLSYGVYTALQGCKPIIISSNSELTLNYFDTLGLPLNNEMIAVISALCLKMAGGSKDPEIQQRRLAMLAEYVNISYADALETWERSQDEQRIAMIRRDAMAFEKWRKDRVAAGMGVVEAYSDYRVFKQENPEDYVRLVDSLPLEEANLYGITPETQEEYRRYAISYFEPKDFPTHSSLVELMRMSPLDHHTLEEVNHLSTMLTSWCRDGGRYGCLFDGQSNFSLTGRVCHFELGQIPDAAKELKDAAGFLLTNYIRQYMISMPRGVRKRWVFEEVARFMNVPGGDGILAEAYAQMRKMNCWVLSVGQQYAQLKGSPLAPIILGNTKLFLLMRQNVRDDLQELAKAIELPESAVESILTYPLPEEFPGEGPKPVYFNLFSRMHGHLVCGTASNLPSEEMLYAASSNGRLYDAKMAAMGNYDTPFGAIVAEAAKHYAHEEVTA